MSWAKEFKEFAVKGNVVDLAVGVIIGVAFGKIVASFVKDIVMPPLGLITGGMDFTKMGYVLKPAVGEAPAVMLSYGMFVQNIFDFVLVAAAIFMAVKVINRMKREEEAAPEVPAEPTAEEKLLGEIRDLLRAKES